MLQNRFNTIAILNIEKYIVKHINNDSLNNKFVKKKNRKIICVLFMCTYRLLKCVMIQLNKICDVYVAISIILFE
jgi:hypothetical protein